MAEHHDVCQEINNLSQKEVISLGDELGLSYPRLKQMTALPEEMVPAWLSMEDTVVKRAEQSIWTSLADSVWKSRRFDIPEIKG